MFAKRPKGDIAGENQLVVAGVVGEGGDIERLGG
jgi:hypothetical protein